MQGKSTNSASSFTRVPVPCEIVFPELCPDFDSFRSLLSQLSIGDALFWCARLNLILSNPANVDDLSKQRYGIAALAFTADECNRIDGFAALHGGASGVQLFFRGQLLELMRWISLFSKSHPNDGDTFLDSSVLQVFRQALLISGEQWNRRVYGERLKVKSSDLTARREMALAPFRAATAENSSGMEPLMALGRGKALMDGMVAVDPAFPIEFIERTQLSLDEYYICWCALMTQVFSITPEKAALDNKDSGIFNVDTYAQGRPLLAKFLDLESQTPDQLREAFWGTTAPTSFETAGRFNTRAIRTRPVLRLHDGRAIVLDPVFCAEKVAVGPLFTVAAQADRSRGGVILSTFGNVFEEHVRQTLRSMYPSVQQLADRMVSPLKGKTLNGMEVEIADACLNNVRDVVLVEVKAVWIAEDLVLDSDPTQYLRQIRKKYGVLDDTTGPTPKKGVAQLANSITRLATGEWIPTESDLSMARLIFPVLLVYDGLLDAPAHGNILANEFKVALKPDEEFASCYVRKGAIMVAPLTIMPIDDLEVLETSVQDFALIDLLRDYSGAHPDRLVSLHNFLASSKYSSQLRASRTVAARTLELLRQTLETFFPGE